MLPLRRCMW